MPAGDVIGYLCERPQGFSLAWLEKRLNCAPSAESLEEIEQGLACGWLEAADLWPERIRATARVDNPYLAAVATLRERALPVQQQLHARTGLPVTLHLVVAEGHAVAQRYPASRDDPEILRELQMYEMPRSLDHGGTALALLAHLGAGLDHPDQAERLACIRADGFCLEPTVKIAGSWVLSSALLDAQGRAYAALCTYDPSLELPLDAGAALCAAQVEATRTLSGNSLDIADVLARMASEHYAQMRRVGSLG